MDGASKCKDCTQQDKHSDYTNNLISEHTTKPLFFGKLMPQDILALSESLSKIA